MRVWEQGEKMPRAEYGGTDPDWLVWYSQLGVALCYLDCRWGQDREEAGKASQRFQTLVTALDLSHQLTAEMHRFTPASNYVTLARNADQMCPFPGTDWLASANPEMVFAERTVGPRRWLGMRTGIPHYQAHSRLLFHEEAVSSANPLQITIYAGTESSYNAALALQPRWSGRFGLGFKGARIRDVQIDNYLTPDAELRNVA